jgi:hypothetical protein
MFRLPHPLGFMNRRQYILLKSISIFALAWVVWYYAALYGKSIKDPVRITSSDIWPGLMITFASLIFIPSWDGSGRGGLSSASAAYRQGGICTTSNCKLIVGGSMGIGGIAWDILIAMHRFLLPLLPDQKLARSALPGWLLLGHLALLLWGAYEFYVFTLIPGTSTDTVDNVA